MCDHEMVLFWFRPGFWPGLVLAYSWFLTWFSPGLDLVQVGSLMSLTIRLWVQDTSTTNVFTDVSLLHKSRFQFFRPPPSPLSCLCLSFYSGSWRHKRRQNLVRFQVIYALGKYSNRTGKECTLDQVWTRLRFSTWEKAKPTTVLGSYVRLWFLLSSAPDFLCLHFLSFDLSSALFLTLFVQWRWPRLVFVEFHCRTGQSGIRTAPFLSYFPHHCLTLRRVKSGGNRSSVFLSPADVKLNSLVRVLLPDEDPKWRTRH